MTMLPTEHDVTVQVEQEFRAHHPDAPEHVDHSNSDHSHWSQEWHRIQEEVVSRLTDEAFFARYPLGRALNAHDPADAGYVEYWQDMHAQISGRPGVHDWSGAAPSAASSVAFSAVSSVAPTEAQSPAGLDGRDEDELANGYVNYELGILRQWHYALNAFDSVMHSETQSSANPDFAAAVLKLFTDKVLGELVSRSHAGEVMSLIDGLVAEADRAKAASVSVALRDFYVGHLRDLSAVDGQLTGAQSTFAAQSRATAARLLADGDADRYLAFRAGLIALHDDARARHGGATLDAFFDALSVEWMNQSIKDPRYDVAIHVRIWEADLSVIDFEVKGPDGDKLQDQLAHQRGGIDLWALKAPREIIYYEHGNNWPAGYVRLDKGNHLANLPAEQGGNYKQVYERLKAQGHLIGHA
jgi:hypothetical protein